MKKYITRNRKGFTLIELLVVIAIIGILSAVVITSISSSRGKARDARRISDIAQIQLALEQYFDKCGQYPRVSESGTVDKDSLCPDGTVNLNYLISVIPKDPLTKIGYGYGVLESNNKIVDYVLKAELEYINSATEGSLIQNRFNLTCDGQRHYCVGPK